MRRVIVLSVALGVSSATANPRSPWPPPLEKALAEAKAKGKWLVLEFSASWCEPCKLVARDLARPEAGPALEALHLVAYDVDGLIGDRVAKKYGVDTLPLLLVPDADGKEIGRYAGYESTSALYAWLLGVPTLALPLDQLSRRVAKTPGDGRAQLALATRLAAAGRWVAARTHYTRAAQSPEPLVAAPATWARGCLGSRGDKDEKTLALELARRFPTSDEGLWALLYLATRRSPPARLIERSIPLRLKRDWDDAFALNDLVFLALRVKAYQAAVPVAERLEALGAKDPRALDAAAEVHHMNGNTARAISLAERALDKGASGDVVKARRKNLARFKRGRREAAADMRYVKPPSLCEDSQ